MAKLQDEVMAAIRDPAEAADSVATSKVMIIGHSITPEQQYTEEHETASLHDTILISAIGRKAHENTEEFNNEEISKITKLGKGPLYVKGLTQSELAYKVAIKLIKDQANSIDDAVEQIKEEQKQFKENIKKTMFGSVPKTVTRVGCGSSKAFTESEDHSEEKYSDEEKYEDTAEDKCPAYEPQAYEPIDTLRPATGPVETNFHEIKSETFKRAMGMEHNRLILPKPWYVRVGQSVVNFFRSL
jgi:hypothetical protein